MINYDDFFNDISSLIGEENVYYKKLTGVNNDDIFIYFKLSQTLPQYADNKVHLDKVNITLELYVKETYSNDEAVKNIIKDIQDKFNCRFNIIQDIENMQNFTLYQFHIQILTDIMGWL